MPGGKILLTTVAAWAKHLAGHVRIYRSISLHSGLLIVVIVLGAVIVYDHTFTLHWHAKVSI